jgi:hypothetical protein
MNRKNGPGIGICFVISSIGMTSFMPPANRKRSASST